MTHILLFSKFYSHLLLSIKFQFGCFACNIFFLQFLINNNNLGLSLIIHSYSNTQILKKQSLDYCWRMFSYKKVCSNLSFFLDWTSWPTQGHQYFNPLKCLFYKFYIFNICCIYKCYTICFLNEPKATRCITLITMHLVIL